MLSRFVIELLLRCYCVMKFRYCVVIELLLCYRVSLLCCYCVVIVLCDMRYCVVDVLLYCCHWAGTALLSRSISSYQSGNRWRSRLGQVLASRC